MLLQFSAIINIFQQYVSVENTYFILA